MYHAPLELALVPTVVACWWTCRLTSSHSLCDTPVHLVKEIVSLAQASPLPVWCGTLSHKHEHECGFDLPTGIAQLPDGDLLVADNRNHRIHRLSLHPSNTRTSNTSSTSHTTSTSLTTHTSSTSSSGHTTSTTSNASVVVGPGSRPGQVNTPRGLCVDVCTPAALLVADVCNRRVQLLAVDGQAGPGPVVIGAGVVSCPYGVAVGMDGRIYVADYGTHCVAVFARDGTHVASMGTYGGGRSQLCDPVDVAVTSRGEVVVVDSGNNRLQVYRADGSHARTLLAGRLSDPGGVSLDARDTVIVADSGNHRVVAAALHHDGIVCESELRRRPTAVAILGDGTVAVATCGGRVVVL